MIPFEYLVPRTLDEAINHLDPDDADIRPVGGGTAVMLMMKAGVLRPTRLVSLQMVEESFRKLEVNAAGELHIGGGTCLSTLEYSPMIQQGWPVLARALRGLSNIRVRNVATLGGNLAHGDPHMDMPPVLAALGASVLIKGRNGTRKVAVQDLYLGYYETCLSRDELITEIIVPPMSGRVASYMKVTTRAAHDWPSVGLAASLRLEENVITEATFVVGAATDRPTRLVEAEQLLIGQEVTSALLKIAGQAAAMKLDVASDQHGSEAYKKHLISVYLGRAVNAACGKATGGNHDCH